MRIGILQTGKVSEALAARHGQYPEMFARLLGGADPGLEFATHAVVDGEFPGSPEASDAWLVTGSRHGVYDDLPWIAPLKDFLRAVRAAGRPIIGICFGHQLMAEAFGGRAEKSDRGWGIGVHDYETVRRPQWMADAPERFSIHALHQDQVTAVPGDATVLATSPFCEYAMLAYGDPDRPEAISIQPHPEFSTPFARDLLALRTGDLIPREEGEAAMATLTRPVAGDAFARWCIDYLKTVSAGRRAA